jgi:hypothetical protein
MTTLLPRDDDNNTIPAMRLRDNGSHSIAATVVSARNAVAFSSGTRVISVFATGPVFLHFGKSDVVATNTDHYYPGGVYYDFALSGGAPGKSQHSTHLAVLAAGSNCTVYISEKK